MTELLSKYISKIKKEEYHIDQKIKTMDLLGVLFSRGIQLIRGSIVSLFFHQRNGRVFVGKRVRIKQARNLVTGANLCLNDQVYIDALARNPVIFGNNVSVGRNTIIECTGVLNDLGEGIVIGDNVGISPNCFLGVRGKIEIGDDTIFGPYVSLHSENHNYQDMDSPIRLQGTSRSGITIGKNCWIGAKATILDGVTVGDGVVVAAGAVVTKDVPDNVVVAGVPARVVKKRSEVE